MLEDSGREMPRQLDMNSPARMCMGSFQIVLEYLAIFVTTLVPDLLLEPSVKPNVSILVFSVLLLTVVWLFVLDWSEWMAIRCCFELPAGASDRLYPPPKFFDLYVKHGSQRFGA